MEDRQITVGFIRRPHGLKGEVVLGSDIQNPSFFLSVGKFTLENRLGRRDVTVESARGGGGGRYIIGFTGLNSLNAVEGFRGSELVTWRSLLPETPDGEFYHFDIIGMRVYREGGERLGVIAEILETGANDVYVIQSESGGEYLLPAAKEIVRRVDIEKREMVVAPMEGMIENV